MISQTEFAVKITKVPMSPARKKKKKDPVDEAEIHAFRGVSGSICWIHVRMCLVKCLNCNRLCHNQLWRRSVRQAWWFAEYTRMPTCVSRSDECQYKTRCCCCVSTHRWTLVAYWLARWIHLWRYRSVTAGRKECNVVSSGLAIIQHESDSAELVGYRSTSHVSVLGFVEWATLFLQELIHGPIDLQGAPAAMQERPPVCVTDCKSMYDHLSAVRSPSTLQDKRSAIDVLIIRESLKKTFCVIRWAPTGLQLADGLKKRQGRGVEV